MVVMIVFNNLIVANSSNQYKKRNLKNNNRMSAMAFGASVRKLPLAEKKLAKPEYNNFNKGLKLFEKYAKKFYYEMPEILVDVPNLEEGERKKLRAFWDVMLTSRDVKGENRQILWHIDRYREPSDVCEDLKDAIRNTWDDLIKYQDYDD